MNRYIDADMLIKKYIDTDIEKFSNSDIKIVLENLKQNILKASIIKPKQEWIPCSERLPEEVKTTYWICTDDGYQCQCRWTNVNPFWSDLTTDWHWNLYDAPQYSKVVAWMPLPEPYEGE